MPATEQAPTLLSVLVRSLDRCKKAVDTSHYSGALEDTGNGLTQADQRRFSRAVTAKVCPSNFPPFPSSSLLAGSRTSWPRHL